MNQMNRRQFTGHLVGGAAIATVAGGMVLTEGCNASQWLQIAINDLPVILQIAESILAIVAAVGGSADPAQLALAEKAAAEVKTDLLLVQTLLNTYNASTDKNTVLQKIDVALLDAQNNLSGIEGALHVTDPKIQASISAGISAALVIVVALETIIPAPVTATASRKALQASNSNVISIKAGYNAALAAAGATQFIVR
jgi:hypothetical protein